ncbi:MAG: triosephosphate isomerase [Alphaproteobacteria bacterium]|jgi:triosephosphate isomerase
MNTLTVANWKMYGNRQDWRDLTDKVTAGMSCINTRAVLATPSAAFADVSDFLKESSNVSLAAQDIHSKDEGAHTGNTSALMLKDFGGQYTLVGHSERRLEHHEAGTLLNDKIKQALHNKICPIYCMGESLSERKHNKTIQILDGELEVGLNDIHISSADDLAIAYEPVWAISSSAGSLGREPSDAELEEVFTYLRKTMVKRFGRDIGEKIKLLYGGSVKPTNTTKIMAIKNISGVLVGGASLKANSFIEIATQVAASEA